MRAALPQAGRLPNGSQSMSGSQLLRTLHPPLRPCDQNVRNDPFVWDGAATGGGSDAIRICL
jgi:hypothetical protein